MPIALALYQPDIANNTGTLLRLGACLGVAVHVIHPAGFPFSRAALKRAGLDYLDAVELVEHASFSAFTDWLRAADRRLVLLTTRASQPHHTLTYHPDDVLMVGRESAGVPDDVAETADLRVRIPMVAGARSINVALAAGIVLGHTLAATGGFDGLD